MTDKKYYINMIQKRLYDSDINKSHTRFLLEDLKLESLTKKQLASISFITLVLSLKLHLKGENNGQKTND